MLTCMVCYLCISFQSDDAHDVLITLDMCKTATWDNHMQSTHTYTTTHVSLLTQYFILHMIAESSIDVHYILHRV